MQRVTYLLQKIAGVPMGYNFALYRYGPLSTGISIEIGLLRSARVLDIEQAGNYAPRLQVIDQISDLEADKYLPQIKIIAETFGPMALSELNILTAALDVTLNTGANESPLEQLCRLYPSLDKATAGQAITTVDWLRRGVQMRLQHSG